ncbi:unnamed protein product [Staurois parvus]|uniref:Uncharacterized protein n=1 Tax=Staurois parvus TaxID=386267 RepID=A0ABN9GWF8_9NEOB|nr:unnamed protein product [Staurois parvus]
MPYISAYQCTSIPHISAHLSCLSVSPISASQCHLSMPVSAAYQCRSVPPISAHQCQLPVPPHHKTKKKLFFLNFSCWSV